MDEQIAAKLVALNLQFYQTFAEPFSATRQRIQPGVARGVAGLPPAARLLDLGCGNGELARYLLANGFQGAYWGLDFSAELLEKAVETTRFNCKPPAAIAFQRADLSAAGWDAGLPHEPFDVILAFAVLHHLPCHTRRLSLLRQIKDHLSPGGLFIFSTWQFHHSPRLASRVVPWEKVNLTEDDLEPGDTLLDWRQGGAGLRYVHLFNEAELAGLAQSSGFHIQQTYISDGKEGNLGLYQIWQR
jgi:tRNA (uracil-5-)-methyltransferase TRM9